MLKNTIDNSRFMMPYWFISTLEGKLLTLTDATFQDAEQRKAFKDMIREQLSFLYTNRLRLPTGLVDSLYKFSNDFEKSLEESLPVETPYFPEGEYKIEFKKED